MIQHYFIVVGGPACQLRQLIARRYTSIDVNQCRFIGVDAGACELLKEQLPIFLAIGDFDSVQPEQMSAIESEARHLVQLQPEKDDTDLEACLKWILQHIQWQNTQIHIINAFGGRVDHELSVVWIGMHEAFQSIAPYLVIENDSNMLQFLYPGNHSIQKIETMSYLSFIAMTPIEKLSLSNVKYPLRNENVLFPRAYVSNEFLSDKMQISFDSGMIVMIQSKDK